MGESSDESKFLKEFYIPGYVLSPEESCVSAPDVPHCPVLVFINSKSGGQLGGNLLLTYRSLLNEKQVSSGFLSTAKFFCSCFLILLVM